QLSVSGLLKTMLLDIAADHFRRDLVPYSTSKIAIFPEFSTPQAPLDPWKLAKDGPGAQTLEPGHDLRDGVPWWEGAKNVDMIWAHLHLFNGDVILFRYIGKKLLHPSLDFALQDITPVLGRPDQVIQGIVDSMGCASEDHAAIVTPS